MRLTQLTVKGVIVIMSLLAPELTSTERELAIAKCPNDLHWAFVGWLDGTHELDGSVIPPAERAQRALEQTPVLSIEAGNQ